jgi:hypothetical protein
MNFLKYLRKITKTTNIAFVIIFIGAVSCFIKIPKQEWWLPLIVIGNYVLMVWILKKTKWDKQEAKNKERGKRLAQQVFADLEYLKPNVMPNALYREYVINPNEINLQYLAEEYTPQNINFNCVCQTREQFELFSKFLLEFQRIGGKVI